MNAPKLLQLQPELHPLSMARLLWKGKLRILAIWLVISVATAVVTRRLPSIYSSEAVIAVDSAKIPERFVSSIVPNDFQDRVGKIRQQIESSARLKLIIEEVNPYSAEGKMSAEDLVQSMRRDISVRVDAGGRRANAFRVGFQGKNPAKVAQVANRLANLYIEENLKTRESQAEGTTEFVDAQLQEAKKKLDELEAAVTRYKVQHNGELPQQQQVLSGAVARLQMEVQMNTEAASREQDNKQVLQNTLSLAESSLAGLAAAPARPKPVATRPAAAPGAPRKAATTEAQALEAELKSLRMRYTDDHPDVRHVKQKLARTLAAEAQAPAPPVTTVAVNEKPALAEPVAAPDENPELAKARDRVESLKTQLALLDKSLEKRAVRVRFLQQQMEGYEHRLQSLPLREQEMTQLLRDYEISKAHYTSLMDKKISADMSTDLERFQKSERFVLLEPARTPTVPSKPNRMAINLIGSGVGLGLGLVVAIGLQLREKHLLGEWELPAEVIVLGRLPYIKIMEDEHSHATS